MAQADGVVRFIRGAAGACADAPDAELVERFAADRDEEAFRALVARYGPVVWAVCSKVLRNRHDAEDAFQATLLVFTRKARDLRAGAAVGGWLHAVAYRVAARVRAARRAVPAEADPTDARPGALDEMTVREAGAALHEELAHLPDRYRAPLVLCGLEGLSRDEAATRLAWTANQVKHGLERGRELLRARLARRGIALGLPLLANLLAAPASAAPLPVIEASVRYATGTSPPAALASLVTGVHRTMWIAKWKWAVAGCVALALTAGGTLAAVLRADPPATKPELVFAPTAAQPKKAAPEPKKEALKPAWDVATEYLQLIIDGKPEQAQKLGDKLEDRYVKELQTAGLKRVKLAMILVNESRVMVVTERAKLKRRPNAEATDEHVVVTLDRKDRASPWRVRENDVADEKKVLREVGDYLEGKHQLLATDKPQPEPEYPKQPWDVALDFLELAVAQKTADALKLTVPGTISENKVGEMKEIGVVVGKPVAVLLNDGRLEVAFQQQKIKDGDRPESTGHVVLMLTKSKDGAWQVKDFDFRDQEKFEPRVQLYLGGRYDEPPAKK